MGEELILAKTKKCLKPFIVLELLAKQQKCEISNVTIYAQLYL